MKIVKKRRIRRVNIKHNRVLFWFIIGLIILLAIVLAINNKKNNEIIEVVRGDLCSIDSDCVPSSSCHPTECVIKESVKERPDGLICSSVCSGPLDCGAGSCGCVQNKCAIIPN